jgi:hypothetical protein
MEKVILPRDVAEAIDTYLAEFGKEALIIAACSIVDDPENNSWISKYQALNEISVLDLMSALVNGYTIEKSPEEKVREYYEELKEQRELASKGSLFSSMEISRYHRLTSKMVSVRHTLNLLGITIEGIND